LRRHIAFVLRQRYGTFPANEISDQTRRLCRITAKTFCCANNVVDAMLSMGEATAP